MKGRYIYYVIAILLGILAGVSGGFLATGGVSKSASQIKVSELKSLPSENSKAYMKEAIIFHKSGEEFLNLPKEKPSGNFLQVTREIPGSVTWVPGGDVDRDGKVNMKDLQVVAENWGRTPPNPRADLNGDGLVDLYDLVGVGLNFGKGGKHERKP